MASSSGEVAFERAVAMATSASIALYHDELAVNMQTQEVVRLSSADYAFELQLLEVIRISSSHDSTHPPRLDGDDQSDHSSHEIPLSMVGPSSSSGSRIVDSFVLPSFASSDDSDDDEDCDSIMWRRDGKQPVTRHTGIWISDGPQVSHSLAVSTPAIDVKLCPICYDTKSSEEMYTHESCFQTFCTACVAQHIHHSLERRVPIRCAGLACKELLNPEHCKAFIPVECYDAWVVAAIEADIPASEKLFCPFPDCSALLLKPSQDNNIPSEVEYNEENIDENNIGPNAECPFCNRLFCMRCESPWHSGLSCARFQELPTEERTESDLYLARMIDQNKWKQCSKCKRVIEKNDGCNHMTCRCGHQFCYVCGSDWQAIHPCVAT